MQSSNDAGVYCHVWKIGFPAETLQELSARAVCKLPNSRVQYLIIFPTSHPLEFVSVALLPELVDYSRPNILGNGKLDSDIYVITTKRE